MSTLMNYTFQSFNFRGRKPLRPFYDLTANIAAEEYGHIELVSYAINLLLTGASKRDRPGQRPAGRPEGRPQQLPLDRQRAGGPAGRLDGQLVERLVRHVDREPEDRPRVQLPPRVRGPGEQDPGVREHDEQDRPGDDRVPARPRRGPHRRLRPGAGEADRGRHRQAAADPDISNKKFPEAKIHEDQGLHRILYQFSPEDYGTADKIWNGPHPEDGQPLTFAHLPANIGAPPPDLEPGAATRLPARPGDDRGHREAAGVRSAP
jgi:hypothetical protein